MYKIIKTDVLIIGGGGAGFRAAIGAREKGASALLLSKGPLARSGATPMAGADYTLDGNSLSKMGFPGEPNDSREKFLNDILTNGFFLNNQKLVDQYIDNAPQRFQELLDWGWKIQASDERSLEGSGISIMDALLKQAKKMGVSLIEDISVLDLLVKENKVTGALGLNVRSGEFMVFEAKSIVMATGGWHKAFYPNTGMRDLSGDGIAMAHRAGAQIGNMEFITFCPNVLFEPPNAKGSLATYIFHVAAGGSLKNIKGESFLNKYDPTVVKRGTTTEWNKCFISHATAKEARIGKTTSRGGVYYGLGDVSYEAFEKIVYPWMPNWKYKALDLSPVIDCLKLGDTVEVGNAVEYFEGGIVIDEELKTNVIGLYAAGECALGPFGANRVLSAITEMLVHGADAGHNAAEFSQSIESETLDENILNETMKKAMKPLERVVTEDPAKIRKQVQEQAHKCLSPIRNEEELTDFIKFIKDIKQNVLPKLGVLTKTRTYNKGWFEILELENMVHLLEATAHSALARKESRGVHYREDFPNTDNDVWLKESIVKWNDGEMNVDFRPVTVTDTELPKGIQPYLDALKEMMDRHSDTKGFH